MVWKWWRWRRLVRWPPHPDDGEHIGWLTGRKEEGGQDNNRNSDDDDENDNKGVLPSSQEEEDDDDFTDWRRRNRWQNKNNPTININNPSSTFSSSLLSFLPFLSSSLIASKWQMCDVLILAYVLLFVMFFILILACCCWWWNLIFPLLSSAFLSRKMSYRQHTHIHTNNPSTQSSLCPQLHTSTSQQQNNNTMEIVDDSRVSWWDEKEEWPTREDDWMVMRGEVRWG